LSARRSRASRHEVGTERFYSGPSLLKKKNSENWEITRYSDKELLSLTRPNKKGYANLDSRDRPNTVVVWSPSEITRQFFILASLGLVHASLLRPSDACDKLVALSNVSSIAKGVESTVFYANTRTHV